MAPPARPVRPAPSGLPATPPADPPGGPGVAASGAMVVGPSAGQGGAGEYRFTLAAFSSAVLARPLSGARRLLYHVEIRLFDVGEDAVKASIVVESTSVMNGTCVRTPFRIDDHLLDPGDVVKVPGVPWVLALDGIDGQSARFTIRKAPTRKRPPARRPGGGDTGGDPASPRRPAELATNWSNGQTVDTKPPNVGGSIEPDVTSVTFLLRQPASGFDQDRFLAALAAAAGIPTSNIWIVSVRPGSTIVEIGGTHGALTGIVNAIRFSKDTLELIARETGMTELRWERDGKLFRLSIDSGDDMGGYPTSPRRPAKPGPAAPQPAREITMPRKTTVLLLSANPNGDLKLDEEVRLIDQKIRQADHRDLIDLVPKGAVRSDDLLQYLNQYHPHVVHFSGHGNPTDEILLVGDDRRPKPLSLPAIEYLFNVMKGDVRTVVLNACYSRPQADAIVKHIDCAIGMKKAIGDRAATVFSASFYRGLGFGRSVRESFEQGRLALLLEGIPEQDTPDLLVRDGVDAGKLVLVNADESGTDLADLVDLVGRTSEAVVERLSGSTKLFVCDRLVGDWARLADELGIPLADRARFERGREPQGVWEWLEQRGQLGDMKGALTRIGRKDLSAKL